MDPSQDLIVFLEGHRTPTGALSDEPAGTNASGYLAVHLRSLKSHGETPHELAFGRGVLEGRCSSCFAEDIELYILNDLVAVFSFEVNPVLRIWNWRSGRLLVVSLPCSWLLYIADRSHRAWTLTILPLRSSSHPISRSSLTVHSYSPSLIHQRWADQYPFIS